MKSPRCKWMGCFPADKLPPKGTLPSSCCFTANIDDSSKGGSHWVTVVAQGKTAAFVCPLGRKPKGHFSLYLSQFDTVFYSRQRIQKRFAATCGIYSCFICSQLGNGASLDSVLQLFYKNVKQDDLFVTQWIKLQHNFTIQ
jgi:hypothetical protein